MAKGQESLGIGHLGSLLPGGRTLTQTGTLRGCQLPQAAAGPHPASSEHYEQVLNVELLVIPDCPHEADVRALIVGALADVGARNFSVKTTVIADEPEALRRGFVGSPTILVNGVDPFEVSGSPVGLGCRIYLTLCGSAGTPTLSGLRQALKRAADPRVDG